MFLMLCYYFVLILITSDFLDILLLIKGWIDFAAGQIAIILISIYVILLLEFLVLSSCTTFYIVHNHDLSCITHNELRKPFACEHL